MFNQAPDNGTSSSGIPPDPVSVIAMCISGASRVGFLMSYGSLGFESHPGEVITHEALHASQTTMHSLPVQSPPGKALSFPVYFRFLKKKFSRRCPQSADLTKNCTT